MSLRFGGISPLCGGTFLVEVEQPGETFVRVELARTPVVTPAACFGHRFVEGGVGMVGRGAISFFLSLNDCKAGRSCHWGDCSIGNYQRL